MSEFSYFDDNNRLVKLDLKIGEKFDKSTVHNRLLNSVFQNIDNGNGILEESEFVLLHTLLSKADMANKHYPDNKLENSELSLLNSQIENKNISIDNLRNALIKKINLSLYTLEAIKERYPSSRYKVVQSGIDNINVYDIENSNTLVFQKTYHKNSMIYEFSMRLPNGTYSKSEYDLSGRTLMYSDSNNHTCYPVADELRSAVLSRQNGESKANDIRNQLKNLKYYNIRAILENYEKISGGVSLFNSILTQRYMRIDTRISLINQIYSVIYDWGTSVGIDMSEWKSIADEKLKAQRNTWSPVDIKDLEDLFYNMNEVVTRVLTYYDSSPNGEIENTFHQGSVGDCWLLASISALNQSPKGHQILSDSVRVLDNGDVQVTLKGVGTTYTISKQELDRARNKFSIGDSDVRAIELAVERYMRNSSGSLTGYISNNFENDLDGNNPALALYLLTGKGDTALIDKIIVGLGTLVGGHHFTKSELDNFNAPNHIVVVGRCGLKSKTESSSGKIIESGHAYAVVGSDNMYVYLINPWSANRQIKVSRAEFNDIFDQITEIDL